MASGALVGALRVTLGLDSAQFEAGTKRARNIAKRDATEIQKIMGGVKTALGGIVAAATVSSLVAAGKRALDYAANLGEVAAAAGVTTAELQEYSYAATQAGLSEAEMEKLLAKLTKTMGEAAAGGKAQVATFRELGIALEDASGRAYTAGEVIPRIADALQKIESPAERARILTDLFGRSGQKLETLLAGGARGVNELRDAAHRLGLVLSEDQIQKADETADKLAEINKQLEVKLAGVVANNADAIMSLADAFMVVADAAASGISWIDRFIRQGQQAVNRAKGWTIFGDPASGGAAMAARWKYSLNQQQDAISNFGTTQPLSLNPKPVVGDGDLPVPSGGGRGRGSRGGRESDRTAEYLERYNREIAGLQDEYLGLQQQITTDVRERARLEHERIENERQAYAFDVDNRIKSGELTKAQGDALKLQYEKNATKQKTLVNWQLDDELTEQELDLHRSQLDLERETLSRELDAARTQEERRRIQLQILENEIALERASLEAVIAKHDSTEIEKQIAQARLDQLGAEKAGKADGIRRNTMGPMEQYLDSLPKSAAELNEAYQRVAAEGLQSLNDGIVDAIMNAKSLGDVFKNVANQIIADLLRIAVQRSITEPLANALFPSGGGGLFGSIGKLFGGGSAAATDQPPGAANGGSFMVGGNPGVDRNLLSLNGIGKVRVSSGEKVTIHKPGQGVEASPVQIVPSPYFDVVVDGRVLRTGGGMMRSQSQMSYRRSRQRLA